MATLPLKSSRNEQRAVILFLWTKGLNANEIHCEISSCMATSVFWADEENARWAEIRIRYRPRCNQFSAIGSSVAWTAASIVLCIGHSEAC